MSLLMKHPVSQMFENYGDNKYEKTKDANNFLRIKSGFCGSEQFQITKLASIKIPSNSQPSCFYLIIPNFVFENWNEKPGKLNIDPKKADKPVNCFLQQK